MLNADALNALPPDEPLPHRSDTPQLSEEAQLAFFDEAMASCATAMARTGRIVRHIDVAGTRVEMIFAGDRLVPALFPALAHLELPADAKADVTLHVWDT